MTNREVTVGRNQNCDIYVDPRCVYASGVHAVIYYDGYQLMYRDRSTNGTMINNVSVHKRAVPIRRGDSILLAGKYPLSWNQIDRLFPPTVQQPQQRPAYGAGTVPNMENRPVQAAPQEPYAAPAAAATPNLSKWSWGAFYFSWLWGLFNGCWWLFPIYLFGLILSLVCLLIPLVNLFILLLYVAMAIVLGIKGREWAWNNRTWNSVDEFNRVQHNWSIAALICFLVLLFILLMIPIFFASMAASIFSPFRFL